MYVQDITSQEHCQPATMTTKRQRKSRLDADELRTLAGTEANV
jgi:hypothetical protein